MQRAAAVVAGDQLQRRSLQLGQHAAHSLFVALARGGQSQALAAAFEQRHAHPGFQFLDLFADRALGQVQRLGRTRDAAKPRNGGERPQQVQGR
ncbi:hypothetical protein D3C72_2049810 [compost metagenome]